MITATRSLHTFLHMLISVSLLGSAVPCSLICSSAAAAHVDAARPMPSHCAKREHAAPDAREAGTKPAAPAPRDTPCDENCPGCAASHVSIPAAGSSVQVSAASGSLLHLALQLALHRASSMPPPSRVMRALRSTQDLPAPNILAQTTTLLI